MVKMRLAHNPSHFQNVHDSQMLRWRLAAAGRAMIAFVQSHSVAAH